MRETAALCALLVAFWPRSWPLALAFVVVMAFSRVHLGAHYPSDVLGGTLIGLWVGALTVLGLDLARRLAGYLHRVPPLGAAWDWVALTRVPGRPDLDPWPARVLRTGALVVAALAALYGLGFVATVPRAGQVYNVLQNVDYFAHGQLTARFDPAVAPALCLVLGPAGLLYAALLAVVLSLAGRAGWAAGRFDLLPGQRRRTVGAALVAALVGSVVLAAAVALALGLRWAGATWFPRPPPFVQLEYTPIPPQWQAAWVSWPARAAPASFPNLHALLVAALGGVLGAHRRLALPAHLVALAAALTAVYFGAAWATDALAGYALGALAAAVALYAARQLAPQPGVTAQVSPAPGPGATTQPAGARPALNAAELES
jgi:membrane-associated phospholipid phosphatase